MSSTRLILTIATLFLISACAKNIETYEPGYYAEGYWVDSRCEPGYTDAYGYFHPAQCFGSYYQEARWVRPHVTVTQVKSRIDGRVIRYAAGGALLGGTAGALIGSGGTIAIASGALVGATAGGMLGAQRNIEKSSGI